MDHRKLHVSITSPERPSKLLALFAIILAFILPFILVKTFQHKQKTRYSHKSTVLANATSRDNSVSSMSHQTANNHDDRHSGSRQSVGKSRQIQNNPSLQKMRVVADNPRKIVTIRPGDNLTLIFSRLGLSAKTLQQILRTTPQANLLTQLTVGQKIKFLIKNKQLIKMVSPLNNAQYAVLKQERGKYNLTIHSRKTNNRVQLLTATMHGSLYSTAKRNNIHPKLVQKMTDILGDNINFTKDVHDGDVFKILYNQLVIKDKVVGIGDVLAVSYRNNGHDFQAIRHINRSGYPDYFSPNGSSLRKAFSRYPMRFSHISSTFSLSRYHPILHYARPHKGVDLAAPIGTPIHATADGRIDIIGRQNGYGNMIKIKHNQTYSTVYGHMLKFQKGLSRGSLVHQGQVIGYVGQTGLASGPHCHYEFHINNQPRNPTTVQLPKGNPLFGRELAIFKRNAQIWLAQMGLSQKTQLAIGKKTIQRKNIKAQQLRIRNKLAKK